MDFSYLGKLVFSSMNGLLWHQEANSFGSVQVITKSLTALSG